MKYQKLLTKLSLIFVVTTIAVPTFAGGVLDRAFGSGGTANIFVAANSASSKVKIQADGKIVVLGNATVGAGQYAVLVRYFANGTPDSSFGSNGVVIWSAAPFSGVAHDLGFQSDSKIIVVGSLNSTVTESVDFYVARFNQNGSLDSSFGSNGFTTVNQSSSDIFYAVAVQPDNKIVAAGTTSQNNVEFAVVRFNTNGTLDTGFAEGGLLFFGPAMTHSRSFRAVAMMPGGRIVLSGRSLGTTGAYNVLAMIESNGTFAQDFGSNGIRWDYLGASNSPGLYFDLAVLPDGRFLSLNHFWIWRHLSNGELDPTFAPQYAGGSLIAPLGRDIAIRSDKKFIVTSQGSYSAMVVYESGGREINEVRNRPAADVAVQSDDKFVTVNSSNGSFAVTRYISITSPATRIADYDLDERSDLTVVRTGSIAYILRSTRNVVSYNLTHPAGEGSRVIPEDYHDISDPGQIPFFYWRYGAINTPAFFTNVRDNGTTSSTQWGLSGDTPVGGDYDGQVLRDAGGRLRKATELAIYRPGTGVWWTYNRFTNTVSTVQWGTNGDKPVPADYDYDGITDYAIYRPSTGVWWVRRSSDGGYFAFRFGIASDIPLTGDYDGDGRADFTVYRSSEGNWYQYLTTEGFRVTHFGIQTDTPVPGDYDGDGRHDIGVFRSGIWYLLKSTEGFAAIQWGASGDTPVSVRYDQ